MPETLVLFDRPESVAAWSAIDDRVMGGVSRSALLQRLKAGRGVVPWRCRDGRLLFSFVRRLPLPRGDEGPPQVGGQAFDKAEQTEPYALRSAMANRPLASRPNPDLPVDVCTIDVGSRIINRPDTFSSG